MSGFITGQDKEGPNSKPVEYMYYGPEDAGTGRLRTATDGKAFRQYEEDSPSLLNPSLAKPSPRFSSSPQGAPKGIGGSEVGVQASGGAAAVHSAPKPPPKMTPEMLMALANKMEQDFMDRTKASEGTTAVDPALIRGGGENAYGGTITPDAPDWLVKYMEGVPNAGETQMGGPGLDKVKAKQYLSQQEMLRHLKAQK